MRKKQNHRVKQGTPPPSNAPGTSEALEQQVLSHPVVQEAMRLFDVRKIAIERTGANGADKRPPVEQPALFFSS